MDEHLFSIGQFSGGESAVQGPSPEHQGYLRRPRLERAELPFARQSGAGTLRGGLRPRGIYLRRLSGRERQLG